MWVGVFQAGIAYSDLKAGSGDDVMVTTATGYTFSGRREEALRPWRLLRRPTTSSSVSGWMK